MVWALIVNLKITPSSCRTLIYILFSLRTGCDLDSDDGVAENSVSFVRSQKERARGHRLSINKQSIPGQVLERDGETLSITVMPLAAMKRIGGRSTRTTWSCLRVTGMGSPNGHEGFRPL